MADNLVSWDTALEIINKVAEISLADRIARLDATIEDDGSTFSLVVEFKPEPENTVTKKDAAFVNVNVHDG